MPLLAVTGRRRFAVCSPWRGDGRSKQPTQAAPILSADVVGYSSLMATNEAATVETLKSYRDIIARLVVRRGGRVVNTPGDASSRVRSKRSKLPSSSETHPVRPLVRLVCAATFCGCF